MVIPFLRSFYIQEIDRQNHGKFHFTIFSVSAQAATRARDTEIEWEMNRQN